MAINQISTANTFEQWLIATQSLIAFANSISDSSGGTFTSNTSEYIITGDLTVGDTVTAVNVDTDAITFIVATGNNITSNNITVNDTITTNNIIISNSITIGSTVTVSNIIANNVTANLVTAVNINTPSDVALKDNIIRITNSLDILEKITGLTFNWKSDGVKSYGVSAQEIEKVLPEIVNTRNDGFKGVNYLNLIAFLIEAVKDLKKDINEIKNQINKN